MALWPGRAPEEGRTGGVKKFVTMIAVQVNAITIVKAYQAASPIWTAVLLATEAILLIDYAKEPK